MRELMIVAALVALLSGCNNSQSMTERPPLAEKVAQADRHPLAEKVGLNCTIQFRRGGPDISGQLRAVSGGWIVAEIGNTRYWIPRHSIRLIQIDEQMARRTDPDPDATTGDPATTTVSEGE